MSVSRVGAALRAEIRIRAGGRCEYCGIHEDDTATPHEPDHIVAEQHGGQTISENLAFACYHCNRLKGPNLASVDPDSNEPAFLFHPRREKWGDHFRLEGPLIVPLTATARSTAALLKLNEPDRIESRRLLILAGRYPA